MSKRITAAVALAVVLAGCETLESSDSCPPEGPKPVCRDVHVTAAHGPASLKLAPEYVEICREQTLVVKIAPPVQEGNAHTAPAGRKRPGWLNAENRERDEIRIPVPADAECGVYKYSLTIDGIGTLDPRFTVTRH